VADTGESLAAKRYAQAAFELAGDNLAGWQQGIDLVAEFMGDDEVRKVLENSRIPQEPKMRLVAAALAELPALQLNLARLLVRKSRTALAPEIAVQFRALVQAQEGIQHARATTAVPLTSREQEVLSERLEASTGHPVELTTEVDPALLGGVVVQIGDRLIDASVRGRLDAMRKALT
jgi:F-type H+-transporting ATPase subunit delta